MTDQLQMHALQISYINSVHHHGIVRRYLEEAKSERISRIAKREEAIRVVDSWVSMFFSNPSYDVLNEARKCKNLIKEASLDELSAFITSYKRSGFNCAVKKLYGN